MPDGYEIESITQGQEISSRGPIIRVHEVTFVTPEGYSGEVTVPLGTPNWGEVARQKIEEQLAQMRLVSGA